MILILPSSFVFLIMALELLMENKVDLAIWGHHHIVRYFVPTMYSYTTDVVVTWQFIL